MLPVIFEQEMNKTSNVYDSTACRVILTVLCLVSKCFVVWMSSYFFLFFCIEKFCAGNQKRKNFFYE